MSNALAQEHRLISRRSPAVSIASRIARRVSLRLDNPSADPAPPGLPHNGLPDEIPRQLSRSNWQASPRQPPDLMTPVPESKMRRSLQMQPPHSLPLTATAAIPMRTLPLWNQDFAQKPPVSPLRSTPKSNFLYT